MHRCRPKRVEEGGSRGCMRLGQVLIADWPFNACHTENVCENAYFFIENICDFSLDFEIERISSQFQRVRHLFILLLRCYIIQILFMLVFFPRLSHDAK